MCSSEQTIAKANIKTPTKDNRQFAIVASKNTRNHKSKNCNISPAPIIENNALTQKYYVGAQKKSEELDKLFKTLAKQNDDIFVSGANLEVGEDGEHLTLLGHKQLKEKIVRRFL